MYSSSIRLVILVIARAYTAYKQFQIVTQTSEIAIYIHDELSAINYLGGEFFYD